MSPELLKFIARNSKHIARAGAGLAVLIAGYIVAFNVNRSIKSMKLDYATALEKYKETLKEAERKLTHDLLSDLEKSKQQAIIDMCRKEIDNLQKDENKR